jgi:hypothetical protein
MNFHLAQVNIAIAKYSSDDPEFSGFVDNLDRIYALAESTPGFVWRHVTVNEDAEAKAIYAADSMIFNMSVWESYEAMHDFIYKSDHVDILRQRAKWFVPQDKPTMALWWQESGSIPSILESNHRLGLLAQNGPTQDAFTFRKFVEAPGSKEAANA